MTARALKVVDSRGGRRSRRRGAGGEGRGARAGAQAGRLQEAGARRRLAPLRRRRLDHQLQLHRVRDLQALAQQSEVAPVHLRHGYLRRDHRERRAHRAHRLPRGPVGEGAGHRQAPRLQALQRDRQLARHHGSHDRPVAAADDRRARPPRDDLLDQHGRGRAHHLPRALGQQMAVSARELLVLPDRRQGQAPPLPPEAGLHHACRRLHALRSSRPERSAFSTARCSRSGASGRGR